MSHKLRLSTAYWARAKNNLAFLAHKGFLELIKANRLLESQLWPCLGLERLTRAQLVINELVFIAYNILILISHPLKLL